MANDKNYLSKIQMPDGTVYWIKDSEARSDYLPLAGGELSGDVSFVDPSTGDTNVTISTDGSITAKSLKLEDIQEITTVIPNVLTLDDDEIKYHSTDDFLSEIGGYSAKVADQQLQLKLGKE